MTQIPYEGLGGQLRAIRQRHSESLAEVSGAVEIEIKQLESYEAGQARPSEDILMLLINHFNLHEKKAVELWEMAGYENHPSEAGSKTPTLMIVAVDVRTMYTDSAEITTNNSGVVMQFMQNGQDNAHLPVAKVGMSYEQAEMVFKTLQTALLQAKYQRGPKQLPPGNITQ